MQWIAFRDYCYRLACTLPPGSFSSSFPLFTAPSLSIPGLVPLLVYISTPSWCRIFTFCLLDLVNNQDLCYNWHVYAHPKRQLAILLIQVIICFALGLLPGLDNFSHLGGFATGLLLGIAVMRAPPRIRVRLNTKR